MEKKGKDGGPPTTEIHTLEPRHRLQYRFRSEPPVQRQLQELHFHRYRSYPQAAFLLWAREPSHRDPTLLRLPSGQLYFSNITLLTGHLMLFKNISKNKPLLQNKKISINFPKDNLPRQCHSNLPSSDGPLSSLHLRFRDRAPLRIFGGIRNSRQLEVRPGFLLIEPSRLVDVCDRIDRDPDHRVLVCRGRLGHKKCQRRKRPWAKIV